MLASRFEDETDFLAKAIDRSQIGEDEQTDANELTYEPERKRKTILGQSAGHQPSDITS